MIFAIIQGFKIDYLKLYIDRGDNYSVQIIEPKRIHSHRTVNRDRNHWRAGLHYTFLLRTIQTTCFRRACQIQPKSTVADLQSLLAG